MNSREKLHWKKNETRVFFEINQENRIFQTILGFRNQELFFACVFSTSFYNKCEKCPIVDAGVHCFWNGSKLWFMAIFNYACHLQLVAVIVFDCSLFCVIVLNCSQLNLFMNESSRVNMTQFSCFWVNELHSETKSSNYNRFFWLWFQASIENSIVHVHWKCLYNILFVMSQSFYCFIQFWWHMSAWE